MKYNVMGYLIGDGFRNILKNKKSAASCIVIMCAAMLMFGMFFSIGQNINHIMKNLLEEQGMEAFIDDNVTGTKQIQDIGRKIKEIEGVNTITYKSKEEAFNSVKEEFKEQSNLLEGREEVFPASYIVTLTNLELNSTVQEQILKIDGITEIRSSNETIAMLLSLAKGIRIISVVLLVILVVISIFIISNTIKLTVYARRKEISIMKYVGATNGFIRWPFIVEGMIIGMISSLISILVVGLAYNAIIDKLIQVDTVKQMQLSFVGFTEMFNLIIIVYLILGIGIGIVGSSNSMRKYLNV